MIYLTNINLNQNELQNAVIQPLATAPATSELGQIYCNSTTSKIMYYNGTEWTTVGVLVESSEANGTIKVDGVEMTVYTLPVASSEALVSLITVILTVPGYCISASIFSFILRAIILALASLTSSGFTKTRTSLPACMA